MNGQHISNGFRVLLSIGVLLSMGALSEAYSQGVETSKMTVVNSTGGTIHTDDGGITWRIMLPAADWQIRENLTRKISAQHQGAATMPSGRSAALPNPTRGAVSIRFWLEQPGEVSITLHDSHGSEVLRANEGPRVTGDNILQMDLASLSDGVYFYRIVSGGRIIAGSTVIVAR
ncbi:MAG TPA: T9SS type A sorting domain-containing protein [Candidatus Kapabacteria bacterium]|nr:T9SS type A sorting domain-containing protein [Candidatus Kapabacteria bacterium]